MDEELPSRDDTTRTLRTARVALWVAGIGTVIAFSAYALKFAGNLSTDQAVWGQFGDYLGGTLNPFFAFLTIFLLVVTLAVQTRELEATRKQAADSAKSLRAQAKALERQVFEQTFFQMLRVFNDVLQSIDLVDLKGNTSRGRDAIRALAVRLGKSVSAELRRSNLPSEVRPIDPTVTAAAYDSFYRKEESEIAQYFRTLYNLLKFVSDSTIPDKKRYTNILRAQLSSQELTLIAFNLMDARGEKLRPLAAQASLLKHLPNHDWLPRDLKSLLAPETFQ